MPLRPSLLTPFNAGRRYNKDKQRRSATDFSISRWICSVPLALMAISDA